MTTVILAYGVKLSEAWDSDRLPLPDSDWVFIETSDGCEYLCAWYDRYTPDHQTSQVVYPPKEKSFAEFDAYCRYHRLGSALFWKGGYRDRLLILFTDSVTITDSHGYDVTPCE